MIPFTVVISVYKNDNANLVFRALNSCENNINKPQEYLIYIDGPINNDIEQVIDDFKSNYKVRIFRSKKNQGLAVALNTLLSEVRTPWFARMDADDSSVPGRFDLQCDFIAKNPNVDVLGGQILEIDSEADTSVVSKLVPITHYEIVKFAKRRNPINHMTVMAKVKPIIENEKYPLVPLAEDYALWARLISSGCILHNLQDILVHADVNRKFYERRGGLRYIYAQLLLQFHLYRCGIINIFDLMINFLFRSFIFILPPYLRGAFYRNFLRG